MRSLKRLVMIPAFVATCGLAFGCFSYHRTVDETQPAVVEAPPATIVTPAPAAVVVPPTTSSTVTTTTDSAVPGVVERQKTTTYSVAP